MKKHYFLFSFKDSDGNEFVFNGVKWVGYDSPERARAKVNFYQLVFFWSTYNTYGTVSIIDTIKRGHGFKPKEAPKTKW